jgi:threonine synthase
MAWQSMLTHLECARCGQQHDADRLANLCPCGGPLLARYDLELVSRAVDPGKLKQRADRSLWRYRELLPVRDPEHVVTLGEGGTPLLPLSRLGAVYGVPGLYMKDEGLNPTGTFKARGATTGVSRAKELGANSIAMPTNGNAGGAWAAYGAKAGLAVALCMPVDAPRLAVVEAEVANARIALVRGQISDAGAIMSREAPLHGWFETATLKEPYRIEGKKTMAYEILEALDWTLPDAIIYPTGGGVGIIGIFKALREMQAMGWIDGKLPRLFAVQAAGCAPIVAAYEAGADTSEAWTDAETIAQGIRVPSALGDFLVLEAVRATEGICLAVTDDAILAALRETGRTEGSLICPEGAAAVAAVPLLVAQGQLRADDKVIILNTGTGMKYPGIIDASPPVIDPGDPLPPEVFAGSPSAANGAQARL